MKSYTKKFEFNKIDYNDTGRKAYMVELEVTLQEKEDGKLCFSANGDVWNTKHTDIVMGGQCIDDIWNEYASQIKDRHLFFVIKELWEQYHLNDLNAGCKHQRKLNWTYEQHPSEPCPTCGYKMGTDWRYNKIDQKDLTAICLLLDIDFMERLRLMSINEQLESN